MTSNSHQLRLLPNLQFIYELHMAQMELATLAPNAHLEPDFRGFATNGATNTDLIRARSAYLGEVDGQPTDYALMTQRNVTRAFNQYITHWFYPYKGKFHPQMVRGLINIMELKPGEKLLDPFSGSGTTVVEGALLGLKSIGYDISPLCVLIGKVKANAVHHLPQLEREFGGILIKERPAAWNEQIADKLSDPIQSFDLLAHLIARSDEARRGQDFQSKVSINREKMLRSVQLMKEACEIVAVSPVPAQLEIVDAR